MVFDKQHLSLFVALAFLAVYANAVPTTALSNEHNVERLRGDLHQFIELIISCLSSTRHNSSKPQLHQFKQITESLQQDVGIDLENNDTPKTRKFDSSGEVVLSSEAPASNSQENQDSRESHEDETSKETDTSAEPNQQSEELGNRREFEIHGDTHGFTPRPSTIPVTELATSTIATTPIPTTQTEDVGLRRLNGPSGETTSQEKTTSGTSGESEESTTPNVSESKDAKEKVILPFSDLTYDRFMKKTTTQQNLLKDLENNHPEIDEHLQASIKFVYNANHGVETSTLAPNPQLDPVVEKLIEQLHAMMTLEIVDPKFDEKLQESVDKWNNAINNVESSKEKTDTTEEIQVRNLIKEDDSKFAHDSSVHPYDALHIYGVQGNGPINKIVFEGGEHHPPRPLTIPESKHLKEFIQMVLETNKLHQPIATFPTGEEIAARGGFNENFSYNNSPWADKPVPLELV